MDTVMFLEAQDSPKTEAALQRAKEKIYELENLFSVSKEDSEISRLNQFGKITLSADSAALLQRAIEISAATDGAYDCTVAPIIDLWGWHTETPAVPDAAKIQQLLPLVGSDKLVLHENSISFSTDGMAIDLGGIAKGYTAGQAARVLREEGITSALLYLGGNICAIGSKPDGNPWVIGIADPNAPSSYLATLSVQDTSVVTSGDYERFFEEDGSRWHHILNPQTGYPATSGLRGVTIVTKDDTLADGLSTALFVMGAEKAIDFWRHSSYDFQFVLIDENNKIFLSDDLKDFFTTNASYEVVQK